MGGWPFVQKRLGNVEEAKDKDKKLLCDPQKLLHTVRNTDFLFKNYLEKLKILKCFKKNLTDFRLILFNHSKYVLLSFQQCNVLQKKVTLAYVLRLRRLNSSQAFKKLKTVVQQYCFG